MSYKTEVGFSVEFLRGSADKELLREFLQYLRDFDVGHPGMLHMNILVRAPALSGDDIQSIYDSIQPPFQFREVIRKQ